MIIIFYYKLFFCNYIWNIGNIENIENIGIIENIESIVRAVFSLHKPFHVLIVDDNSPDKTADKVRELQS